MEKVVKKCKFFSDWDLKCGRWQSVKLIEFNRSDTQRSDTTLGNNFSTSVSVLNRFNGKQLSLNFFPPNIFDYHEYYRSQ